MNDREWLAREISRAKSERRLCERQLDGALRRRRGGEVGIVIAIIGLVLLVDWWVVWAILIVAGGLMFSAAARAQREAQEEIAELNERIADYEGKAAAT